MGLFGNGSLENYYSCISQQRALSDYENYILKRFRDLEDRVRACEEEIKKSREK